METLPPSRPRWPLLIEPYGIETWDDEWWQDEQEAFNRTLWN